MVSVYLSSDEWGLGMPPGTVHFNGSVNLPDAETVMREISSRIPTGVRRIPDGEPGERGYWILFQIEKFRTMDQLELAGARDVQGPDEEHAPVLPQLRLADGVSPESVEWPDLGYAEAYLESYEIFRSLRADGTVPAGVRFQLQYPTPIAPLAGTIVDEDLARLAPSYEAALFADLGRVLDALPENEVAVQWDVAVEFALLEGGFGFAAVPLERLTPGLVRCVDRVPERVPVGMHLCYGDYGHQHFRQPESLLMQVRVVNAVGSAARRPVSWFSFTVPQDRGEAAYFAPLAGLETGPDTELSFGLVPYYPADQPDGTTAAQVRLIDENLAASASGSREWAISTECGLGRVERGDVPKLLDLHREILEAYGRPAAEPA